MSKNKYLADRLEEVLVNGRWIANTNVKDQIESLSWEDAVKKIGNHNSIAQLTFHLNYYLAGILQVFRGGELEIRDKYSFDMTPIENESDWKSLIQQFNVNSKQFINYVKHMSEEKLQSHFVKVEYGTYEKNIDGLIEHSYYHLGQISLLNKLIQ